ncbi:MAG: HAD family hydrolase [Candidatus Azotimanducaceae bacterium WSBS_2022_MAG_OTU7]
MQTPELIIFDLDGTLLNTLESIASAYNSALATSGYPTHPVEAFRHIIGNGARVAAQRCLPSDRQSETDIKRCLEQFQLYYEERWKTASPYAGIVELLSSLPQGLKLAVLSNKDDRFTQRCVGHFFPGTFNYVLGHRPDVPHKPNPQGGNKLIADLGVTPITTWLVGDTATDMDTAAACKIKGIGVLWGFRERDELVASGAVRVVDTPMEILELLR